MPRHIKGGGLKHGHKPKNGVLGTGTNRKGGGVLGTGTTRKGGGGGLSN